MNYSIQVVMSLKNFCTILFPSQNLLRDTTQTSAILSGFCMSTHYWVLYMEVAIDLEGGLYNSMTKCSFICTYNNGLIKNIYMNKCCFCSLHERKVGINPSMSEDVYECDQKYGGFAKQMEPHSLLYCPQVQVPKQTAGYGLTLMTTGLSCF